MQKHFCLLEVSDIIAGSVIDFCHVDAGYYSVLPYAIAQGTVELPYILVQSVIYAVIVYVSSSVPLSTDVCRYPLKRCLNIAQVLPKY